MTTGKDKTKNKGGRPTKYKERHCQEIVEFFDIDFTKEVDTKYENKKGDTWTKSETVAVELSFLSAFARKIGVCRDTLDEWCKVHPEFSDAYKKAKALQKEHLITCGLLGLFPAAAFIFTAKNIAGMRDKIETDITSDGKPIPAQIIVFGTPPKDNDNPD